MSSTPSSHPTAPDAPPKRAPRGSVAPAARALKEQRDTAAGCRERAAADLLQSASMPVVNERQKMESSAASWTARADLLERLEASFEARRIKGIDAPEDVSGPRD